ncbi:hypothetical protein AB4396_00290 [Vibrio cyclitrophicus]|uniref:hypothetical protein n=1 Tax=Vibrio sp. R78045 TaxID=3093868 RepID=UPI0035533C50
MSLFIIQAKLLKLCQKIKLIPDDLISLSHIEHHIPIERQLDEYRELIEEIEKHTQFFSTGRAPWSKNHAYTLDEYLQALCLCKSHNRRRVGVSKIRPRPAVLSNQRRK